MKTLIITYPTPNNIKEIISINKEDYIVAVEHAYLECLKQNIKVDFLIGDFDSLKDYKKLIKNVEYFKLNENKDHSDTHYAIEHSKKKTPNNQIYLLGGIGGKRFEHTYANILLLINNPDLIILTNESKIKLLSTGKFKIDYYGYVNIFSVTPSIISLKGFKYNLDKYNLIPNDPLGLSNELKEKEGTITVYQGQIILIETEFDH